MDRAGRLRELALWCVSRQFSTPFWRHRRDQLWPGGWRTLRKHNLAGPSEPDGSGTIGADWFQHCFIVARTGVKVPGYDFACALLRQNAGKVDSSPLGRELSRTRPGLGCDFVGGHAESRQSRFSGTRFATSAKEWRSVPPPVRQSIDSAPRPIESPLAMYRRRYSHGTPMASMSRGLTIPCWLHTAWFSQLASPWSWYQSVIG